MKVKLLILASCMMLFSCGEKAGRGSAVAECAVETIGTTTVELNSSYPASIRGKQDVEIRPQVSGFITKVCVDEGEQVRKGQVLFVIDKVQYEATYNSAVAAVNTAKASVSTQEITVKNKRELNKKSIISDYDLAMAENTLASAKAQLASAEAMLASAKQNLSFTDVKSPSDGIVSTIPYRLGSLVSPSIATPLTIVSDFSEMFVYASITEKDWSGADISLEKILPNTIYYPCSQIARKAAGKSSIKIVACRHHVKIQSDLKLNPGEVNTF